MRTIHDLEAAFADLADTAPDKDVLSFPVAEGHREGPLPARRNSRMPRWAAVTGGSLVAAAVAATVVVVSDGGTARRDDKQAAAPADFTRAVPAVDAPGGHSFDFTADAPARTKWVQQRINETGQMLQFLTDVAAPVDPSKGTVTYTCPGRSECKPVFAIGSVTLYAAGEFDPADAIDGTPVDVNGHRGYSKAIERLGPERVLRWEYAPGAWAEAEVTSGSDADQQAVELRLAESVTPADLAVRVPVDLEGVPGNPSVSSVSSESGRDSGTYEFSREDTDVINFVGWGENAAERAETTPGGDTVSAGGHSWRVVRTAYQVEAFLKGGPLPVHVSFPLATGDSDVRDMLENATFASDLADRSTWFTAQDDLP